MLQSSRSVKHKNKVLKRFNKYINGEREDKYDPNAEVKVLDDSEVKIANGK